MHYQEIAQILNSCEYKDWSILLRIDGDRPYLQVGFYAFDKSTNVMAWQTGRKWLLSYNMCKTEIVQTAWLAVLKAEEHEARETFLYSGKAVFNTHIDIEELWKKADLTDVRKKMPTFSLGSEDPNVPVENRSSPSSRSVGFAISASRSNSE